MIFKNLSPEIKKAIAGLILTSVLGSFITSLYQYLNSRDVARNTNIQATYWNMRTTSSEITDFMTERKYASFTITERYKSNTQNDKTYDEYYNYIRKWNEKFDGILSKIYFDLDLPFGLENTEISSKVLANFDCKDIIKSMSGRQMNFISMKQNYSTIGFCFREIHRNIKEIKECVENKQNCDITIKDNDIMLGELQSYTNSIICILNNRVSTVRKYLGSTNYWVLNIFKQEDVLDIHDLKQIVKICHR